jgi:hypothetical protein
MCSKHSRRFASLFSASELIFFSETPAQRFSKREIKVKHFVQMLTTMH